MDLMGNVSGSISLGGGAGGIDDMLVKKTTEYESIVENNKAYLDLTWVASKTDLTDYVTLTDMEDYYDKIEVNELINNKQDNLIAGDNITINNNVISASGGVEFSSVEKVVGKWFGADLYSKTYTLTSQEYMSMPYVTDLLSANIDNIMIDYSHSFIKSHDNSGNYITALSYWNPANNFDCRLQINTTNIYIQVWKSGDMTFDQIIITLLYTKR